MEANKIYNGDCLELMKEIEDKSINLILADLPYATTQNSWDSLIPFEPLWEQYNRIIKDNGAIVLSAQTPFDKTLGCSNIKMLKYEWIWIKQQGTGFLNAKKMPLKATENILVFYKSPPTYNPQMRTGFSYVRTNKDPDSKTSTNYGKYKTQGYMSYGDRYPLNWIQVKYDTEKLHPTQKPVSLFEYFVKTYTNEGDLVLDNCAGSGTTGIACINTNRRWICMEKDPGYFQIASDRLNQRTMEKNEENRQETLF